MPAIPPTLVDMNALLHAKTDWVIIDVRSPAEFAKAHIPEALNLPLFSNEERAIVGTTYKQQSTEQALLIGLEFAGLKMRQYIEQALLIAPEKKVLVYCWRGGKRSESMGWLLSMAGFEVHILKGGYKYYRRYALHYYAMNQPKLIVLGGQTGIGKTYVLHQLLHKGEQIIDLEKLANHKGSAFGSLGEAPQPSTEHFENLLFEQFRKLDLSKRIFVENESQAIGTCLIPRDFFVLMKQYYYIQYTIPYVDRVDRLVQQYAIYPISDLKARFDKIKNKIGGEQLKRAYQFLDQNDFGAAAVIALKFYDKTYLYGFENNTTPHKLMIDFEDADTVLIAEEIIKTCNQLNI
ncbi:MAG: tRNA 2-selenouridine(34) synthase MnmH [Bacteroidetes bacterium]|nr:tRNA 2-selenouridine(34) synthase MnmH [Bacteroidota bacterium]